MIALPAFALVLGLVPLAIPVSVPRDRPSLSEKDRQAVVDAAARSLAEGYVYEDSGRAYGVRLRERLRSGRYDTLATRADFARALTRDLQEMSADRHLRILPDSATGAEGPRMMRTPVGGERRPEECREEEWCPVGAPVRTGAWVAA